MARTATKKAEKRSKVAPVETMDVVDVLAESMGEYAKDVIMDRAIPDARDGLKPVQRHILWVLKLNNLHPSAVHLKTNTVVGNVMPYHAHGDCLDGDTVIPLLDGTTSTMRELYERGEDVWILAFDEENAKFVPALAHDFRIGQWSKKLYHIVFENGYEIVATGNHPFMLSDKRWVKAEDLTGNMILNFAYLDKHPTGRYATLGTLRNNQVRTPLHKLVFEFMHPGDEYEVIHHIDGNPLNNVPENLCPLTRGEHAALHKDYLDGLALGREAMFSKDGKLRERTRRKNSKLAKEMSKFNGIMRAVHALDVLCERGLELTHDNYESLRSEIYNLTKIETIVDRGYCRDFDDFVNRYIDGERFYHLHYECDDDVNAKRFEGIDDKRQYSPNYNLLEPVLFSYEEDGYEHKLRMGDIRRNSWEGFSAALTKWFDDEAAYNAFVADKLPLIKRVWVEELVESRPMYDFTVDGFHNMLVCANDPSSKANLFVVAHNSSIKTAIDNLSQDWVLNTPLTDIQGNNGSIDGSPAAAGRYTHVRQAQAAALMLERVDTGGSKMVDNYDNTRKEPESLPARYPVALTNGAFGIAEGISTSIMPHNPIELLDGCIRLVNNPDLPPSKLATTVKGPDFPTGGAVINCSDALMDEMKDGVAKYTIRGKAEIKMGTSTEVPCIEITELPWNPWGFGAKSVVTTVSMIESIDAALEPIRQLGITEIRDETDEMKGGISIKVLFRKNVDRETVETVLEHLYQKSLLQLTISCQNMMISRNKPVILGIKEYLLRFNSYRLKTLRSIWEYDVAKLVDEIEIADADIVAMSDPDGLMKITRESHGKADMVSRLMKKYKLSERQAEHIAGMPLYRFNDAAKLLKEYQEKKKSLLADKKALEKLLSDEKAALAALVEDLKETRDALKKLGCSRKTEILDVEVKEAAVAETIDQSKLIPDKPAVVVFDEGQGMFRMGEQAYANQTAAGKAKASIIPDAYKTSTRGYAIAVASNGQTVIWRVNDMPNANLDSNVEPLSRTLSKLDPSVSFVGGAVAGDGGDAERRLVIVTEYGLIKVIDGETLAKDAERAAKGKPVISKAHGLKQKGDKVLLARMFTVKEMEGDVAAIEADVRWQDKNGARRHATRRVMLSELLDRHDGLSSSGKRYMNTYLETNGIVDRMEFVDNVGEGA